MFKRNPQTGISLKSEFEKPWDALNMDVLLASDSSLHTTVLNAYSYHKRKRTWAHHAALPL